MATEIDLCVMVTMVLSNRKGFSLLVFSIFDSLALPVSPVQLEEKSAGNDVG